MSDRVAYLNGRWVNDATLAIPIADLGFTMGVTVTERLRTFAGKVFRQAEHVARMSRSLAIIGLTGAIANEIDDAISEFVNRNAALREPDDDWSIVAFATPGAGRAPTVCVHGVPLPFRLWAAQYDTGVPVWVSDVRQVPANCWPAELKCRSRMHYYLADQHARTRDPQARAILLDQEGHVGEASTANLVIYRPGEGLATPMYSKVLPGVTISVVEELAHCLGISFHQRDIAVDELKAADEVWLTSTSVCVLPVTTCDGQRIGPGTPGPMYRRMLAAWNDFVGVDVAGQARRRSGFPA
jgi:branched-subunit amino acid aminotransferase/4-amino-4-deoxychorismate lyase